MIEEIFRTEVQPTIDRMNTIRALGSNNITIKIWALKGKTGIERLF